MERSISQARIVLRKQALSKKGGICPCCDQLAKVYKRQIHSTMSRMLIALYNLGPGYHHLNAIMTVKNGWGDFAKLSYWGLIEEMVDDGLKPGRTTGYWKITSDGKLFVQKGIGVSKYALVYNGKCITLDGESVLIDSTLGKNFNYQELMAS